MDPIVWLAERHRTDTGVAGGEGAGRSGRLARAQESVR
jgi:hypothetical protein